VTLSWITLDQDLFTCQQHQSMKRVFGKHMKICMITMQCGRRGNALHSSPKHKSRLRFWGKVCFITTHSKFLPRLANVAFFITEHRHLPELIITTLMHALFIPPFLTPLTLFTPHHAHTAIANCSKGGWSLKSFELCLVSFLSYLLIFLG
jgi:hypothetical protein